jgi:hypothetical protein
VSQKSLDDFELIKTPAQKIIAVLKDMRAQLIQQKGSKEQIVQLTYAIDKISSREIYDIDKPFLDNLDLNESRSHSSVTKGWIHEYSNMGLDILRDISLERSLIERKKAHALGGENDSLSPSLASKSRPPSINTVNKFINDFDHLLQNVHTVDFNIH